MFRLPSFRPFVEGKFPQIVNSMRLPQARIVSGLPTPLEAIRTSANRMLSFR
jgi:hypothetical protein